MENNLGEEDFNAPMTGTLAQISVEPETVVSPGDRLLMMEAMKMEYIIVASRKGVVNEFYFQSGGFVDAGAKLLAFEERS